MSRIEEIEKAIATLPAAEIVRLKEYVDELAARCFDERIERDIAVGKLDWLADEAIAEHKAGKSRKLP